MQTSSRAASASPSSYTHWILVGCAPRVTHRVSKWVTHSARDSWRRKWADKVFSQVLPALTGQRGHITTLLADTSLGQQTEWLIQQHGAARVLDARRPRMDVDTLAVRPQPGYGFLSLLTTLLGTGMLVGID